MPVTLHTVADDVRSTLEADGWQVRPVPTVDEMVLPFAAARDDGTVQVTVLTWPEGVEVRAEPVDGSDVPDRTYGTVLNDTTGPGPVATMLRTAGLVT